MLNRSHNLIALSLLLTAIFLSGCVNLDPQPDRTRFYELSRGAEAKSLPPQPNLVIRRVDLASYLNDSKIVLRVGDHELAYQALHRWSGPLDQMIAQSLAEHLESIRPEWRVRPGPQTASEWTLDLRVLKFEGGPGRAAHLILEWQATSSSSGTENRGGRIVETTTWNGSFPDLVDQLAGLLGEAAAELAEDLD